MELLLARITFYYYNKTSFKTNRSRRKPNDVCAPSCHCLDGVGLELSASLRIPITHDLHDVLVVFQNHLFTKIKHLCINLPMSPK